MKILRAIGFSGWSFSEAFSIFLVSPGCTVSFFRMPLLVGTPVFVFIHVPVPVLASLLSPFPFPVPFPLTFMSNIR